MRRLLIISLLLIAVGCTMKCFAIPGDSITPEEMMDKPPGWYEHSTKNEKVAIVKALAKEGLICEVFGHRWESGCSQGAGCLAIHNLPMRYCPLCREVEELYQEWR